MSFDFSKASAGTPALKALLAKAGSGYESEASAALHQFAKAAEGVIREGLFAGDITSDIFTRVDFDTNQSVEFELDPIAPGTQKEYTAWTIPNAGYMPQFTLEGDYVTVPTYRIGAAIDWLLRYSKSSRLDVAGRALDAMKSMVVKKRNDDGWHTLLAAGSDRNIVVYDSDAGSGQFTKRIVSLAKVIMRRQGGGNSSTINRSKLTDLYVSPESVEDVRNWGVDLADDTTRREIYIAPDGSDAVTTVFKIKLHDIDELGEQQEYQNFYLNQIGGALPGGKLELAVGLDLSPNKGMWMPVREDLQIFEDPTLHRHQKSGLYSWLELGFCVLDNRKVILLSI